MKKMLLLAIAAVILVLPGQAFSEWTVGKPIVSYWPAASWPVLTDAIAQQAVDGGYNLVWALESSTELDIAQEYGLRAMWGGSLAENTLAQIRSHPALYGYYVYDEPSMWVFGGLAITVANLRTVAPEHFAYINLFPSYASSEQLRMPDYSSYLSQYISAVRPSLIAYDHYQFMTWGDTSQYFLNLKMVSQVARQAGLPFMQTVQASAWSSSWRVPNAGELRFLNYTTLAYGAQGISYWAYSPPQPNAGGLAPNPDGSPTSVYTALQSINPQFVAIAEWVQPLASIEAYHLGDQPPGTERLPGNSPFSLSPNVPDTTYLNGQPVKGMLLGLFGLDDQLADAAYAIVVNLDYGNSKTTTVIGPENLSVFDATTGVWSPAGSNQVPVDLLPGGGMLVGLTSVVPEPTSLALLSLGALLMLRRKR